MVDVLFDATRLLMRASGVSPTGIDRVTEAYGRWLFSRSDVNVIPVCAWGGVATPLSRRAIERILERGAARTSGPSAAWSKLKAALSDPSPLALGLRPPRQGRAPMARPIRYARATARTLGALRVQPVGPGAIYINVSHFGLEQSRLLERLVTRGVRPVVMLHDLIPLDHPEFCSPSAGPWHRRRVVDVLAHADLVITNSVSTAADLARFARENSLRTPNTVAAPLGLETTFLSHDPEPVSTRPYFVCIGTIEPRKNLILLLTLWRRMAERLGDATPPLVLAGQRGWETEAIVDHLERSPPVRRFVHEASGLTDRELASLIAGARALLSPSFIEGFNLPVAEAVALGTPVIASDIPVHRELASGAHLIDPLDGPAWLAAIEAATRSRGVSVRESPPTWPDHFAIVERSLGWESC